LWSLPLAAFLFAGDAASKSTPGIFDATPLGVSAAEAQGVVDYLLPIPKYLPVGTVPMNAYLLLPSHLTMFPDVTDAAAKARLVATDRRRPVALKYVNPQGSFAVFVSGISWNVSPSDTHDSHPFGLAAVSGLIEIHGGQMFAVREGAPGVTSLTWQAPTFTWFGEGQVIAALLTIEGNLPKAELIRIAQSIP